MPKMVVPLVYLTFILFVGGVIFWQRREKIGGKFGKVFYYYLVFAEGVWIVSLLLFGLIFLTNGETIKIYEKSMYVSLAALWGIFPAGLLTVGLRSIDEKISVSLKSYPSQTVRLTTGFSAVVGGFVYILFSLLLFVLPISLILNLSFDWPFHSGWELFVVINILALVLAIIYSGIRMIYQTYFHKSGRMKK